VRPYPCFPDFSASTNRILLDVWSLDSLIPRVGSVDRSSALKALVTWVDLGVLKEDTENSFRLLEVAEDVTPGAKPATLKPGVMSLPVNLSIHMLTKSIYALSTCYR
jgi:hypothetical protein